MQPSSPGFRPFRPDDVEALVGFLTGEPWPTFSFPMTTRAEVDEALDEGLYIGADVETWWIDDEGGATMGFVMMTGLGARLHPPDLTIRLGAGARGRGLGRAAVRFATDRVFTAWPETVRFVGSTRVDNHAMRRTFAACGWVLEGIERHGWIEPRDGRPIDAVRYSITRHDWEAGAVTPVDWPGLLDGRG